MKTHKKGSSVSIKYTTFVDNHITRVKLFNKSVHRLKTPYIKFDFSYWLVGCILAMLVLGSCNTKKYLAEDEYLLERNTIIYDQELASDNSAELKSEIPSLLRLKPNTGFLWIPRRWFYYRDKKVQKDNWFWNLINKNIAEEPAIIQPDILIQTATSMALHLKNHGYFDVTVNYEIDTFKKRHEAAIDWHIAPGKLYRFDTFNIESEDTVIQKIIDNDWRNKEIKPGVPISIEYYDAERKRLVTLLRNKGYANFSQSFIDQLSVDTTGGHNNVVLRILPAPGLNTHPRYMNRNIFIYAEGATEKEYADTVRLIAENPGIHFIGEHFKVRPSAIEQSLRLHSGSTFSRQLYDETQAGIGNFPIYKFPVSQLHFDTLSGQYYVDYKFFLKPRPRYEPMIEPAIYYSTITNASQLLGLSLDLSLTDRNIFGGGESLTTSIEGSTELSLDNFTQNNTYNLGISNSLRFPRLIRYPFIYDVIENLIPEESSDNHLVKRYLRQARSHISLNYLYTFRNNYYKYHSFSAAFGYTWHINKNYSLELDHIGFDWWIPEIFDAFRERISANQYFLRAFDQRLLTGAIFRRARLNFITPRPNFLGERWAAYIAFETSGLEIMAIDGVRSLMGYENKLNLGENQFAKFLRLDMSGTYKRHFRKVHEIAFRVSTGIALGLDTFNVPYIRQFYVGGPYSLRAWPVRGIGPGDNYDPAQIESRFPPYFTGNFKFEANAEYRFKLFWLINGAVFLDMGNVWNIFDDDFEGNTTLSWDSYKQISIGSGAGIRMDNALFVVRLDLGYPIKNPYKLDGSYFHPVQHWSFKNIQWNIAFGYPF